MKKILSILLFMLMAATASWAQMSDAQVVNYIKEKNAAGIGQQQIAKELLLKGVTQAQLQRIKQRYDAENAKPTKSISTKTEEVERVNNSENGSDVEIITDVADEVPLKQIFGHNIFRSKRLTFEPQMNIPTPANYTLGPGDELIIDIYGDAQSSNALKIAPDGSVTIPGEGPVNVAGLTVTQAQNRVRKAIGGHYQGSSIKVSVGQTRSILVNVMGEVVTPGTYTLSAFSTVFNALYLAGGITDIGTLRNIKVSRNGKIISTIDVYEFIVNGKLAGNIMLHDNDVIMVGPYENLVEITGKIKRPMYYELKKSESLQSLLTYAGGFTGDAYTKNVRIERKSSDGLTVHNVDEWDFNNFHNEDGDVVVVAPIIERMKNTVSVTGAVFRPGSYKLSTEVNTVKTLIAQAGGLLEQAVTTRAVLQRLKADRTLQSVTIDLANIMNGSAPDVSLQNEDQLIIATSSPLIDAQAVHIEGAVFNAGKYPYSDNLTIEDLITIAGGLKENASIENIEVARRITNGTNQSDIAQVFPVNLKSGLKIEEQTGFKLEPYDHVTIHYNPYYHTQKAVTISGEVLYGGAYVLSNKEERLSDLVKRAGGLTEKAYINGVQLVRKYTENEMALREQMLEVATNAADSISARKQMSKREYSVGIDLKKALANPGSVDDLILAEGDAVYVPQMSNVVKISGEVLYPNTVTFSKGKGTSYYINQAGGVGQNGKKKLAYVVYANGQVSPLSKGKIEPGCEIVVPSKVEKKVDTAKVSMWATLASTVATVGAVVSNIVK